MTDQVDEFLEALMDVNYKVANDILQTYLVSQNKQQFVEDILTPALRKMGDLWDVGEVALAQIYMGSRICETIVDELFDVESLEQPHQKIAIVTLEDEHGLGRRIVRSVFKSVGIPLHDYGQGILVDELADLVMKDKIDILLISVLMYPSALKVIELKSILQSKDHQVKILVGGAPFTIDPKLWVQVGADGCGISPMDSVKIVQEWEGSL